MACESMDSEKFLKHYELEFNKEFEKDGLAAKWANDTSAHRYFGDEDASISLRNDHPHPISQDNDAEATLSPDGKLLAVSTNAIIRIYQLRSREVLAELVGHQGNVSQLHFAPMHPDKDKSPSAKIDGDGERTAYILFSSSQDGDKGTDRIILWSLDKYGKQLRRAMPFAIQDMADRAVDAISADLTGHHSLSSDDIQAIREDFAKELRVADAKNRVKHLPLWEGEFTSFGTYPISPDSSSFFYTVCGETTQHGERPPEELPQIVVVDIQSQAERCRLKGHTDAIMWAGWSSDGETIATASWDEYHKIWDARTGECRHTIGPTKGQNWSGAFSPDGKYVLLSGGRENKVAIYNVETGEMFANLEQEGLELAGWIRELDWNPAGDCIAISNERDPLLWHPFDGKIETILSVADDETMLKRYNEFTKIKWVQGGKKLVLQDRSHATFVWDREKNVKWRFERPHGMPLDLYTAWVGYVDESNTVVSLDGDWKIRYWKLE